MGSRAPQLMEGPCCRRRSACQREGSVAAVPCGIRAGDAADSRVGVSTDFVNRLRRRGKASPLGGTGSVPAAKRPRETLTEPTGDRCGVRFIDGFDRREMVQLLLQSLGDLGFDNTKAMLQRESNVELEVESVATLRRAVLAGSWTQALTAVRELDITEEASKAFRFHILERCLLEAIASQLAVGVLDKSEFREQAAELLEELSLAASDADSMGRSHKVDEYLSCQTLEALEQAAGWRLHEDSRQVLWDRAASHLPPHLVVPPRRLSVLLWQAVRYQQLHCLYRDIDGPGSTISLLQDYRYELPPLPTRCAMKLEYHSDEVWFATSSHDGQYIASASKDLSVVIWQFSPPASFLAAYVLKGHTAPCSHVAWSPDDRHVLTASNDCTVRLWKTPDETAAHIFTKHTDIVTCVAWLQDSRRFLSAGFDRSIHLWDIDGSDLYRWEVSSRIQDMGVTHDGNRMVVVNSDQNMKVIDISSRRELFALPESDAVTSLQVSRFREEVLVNIAQQVSSSQHAPVIRLWDLAARRVVQRYLGHLQGRFVVRSCFGGPREEFVVSGSEDAQVYIWHRHYGSLLEVLSGHSSTVNSVSWFGLPSCGSKTISWMVSVSDDHTLRVWTSGKLSKDSASNEKAVSYKASTGTHSGLHREGGNEHEAMTTDEGDPPISVSGRPA